jgi:hypothetical protein
VDWGNKKPRAVVGAGFFGSLQVICQLPGYMPTPRISVGNEEYEYERKEKLAGSRQQIVDRRGTIAIGGLAVAVALRHETTLGQLVQPRQQFHVKVLDFVLWTSRSLYEITSKMSASKEARPHSLQSWTASRQSAGSHEP